MRASEFWRLVEEEFGAAPGRALVRDHVVGALGHRTPAAALEAGEDLQAVWFALCADLEVPRDRWWGRDEVTPKRPGASRASNTRSG